LQNTVNDVNLILLPRHEHQEAFLTSRIHVVPHP